MVKALVSKLNSAYSYGPSAVVGAVFLFALIVASKTDNLVGTVIGAVGLAVTFIIFRKRLTPIAIILVFIFIAFLNFNGRGLLNPYTADKMEGKVATINATLISSPYTEGDRFVYTIKDNKYGKIKLTAKEEIDVSLYQNISGRVKFNKYANRKVNIHLGAQLIGSPSVTQVKSKDIGYYFAKFKQDSVEYISKHTSQSSIICAVVLGDRSEVTQSEERAFTASGLTHILTFSGIHFSTSISFLCFMVGIIPLRRKYTNLLKISIILSIILVVGGEPSVLRAGIASLVAVLATYFGRQADGVISLGLSVIICAIINPYCVTSISFMLSAGASLGISLFYGRLRALVKRPKNKLLCALLDTLLVTLTAQVFIIPLLMIYFDRISFMGLISYLLVFFAVNIIIISTISSILLHLILPDNPLSFVLIKISDLATEFTYKVSNAFTGLPFSAVAITATAILICLLVFGAFYFGVAGYILKGKINIKIISVIMALALSLLTFSQVAKTDQVEITLFKSGTVLVYNERKTVVIGGAKNDFENKMICDYLYARGKDTIDLFIPTDSERHRFTIDNQKVNDIHISNQRKFAGINYEIVDEGYILDYKGNSVVIVNESVIGIIGVSAVICTHEVKSKVPVLHYDSLYENSFTFYLGGSGRIRYNG